MLYRPTDITLIMRLRALQDEMHDIKQNLIEPMLDGKYETDFEFEFLHSLEESFYEFDGYDFNR